MKTSQPKVRNTNSKSLKWTEAYLQLVDSVSLKGRHLGIAESRHLMEFDFLLPLLDTPGRKQLLNW